MTRFAPKPNPFLPHRRKAQAAVAFRWRRDLAMRTYILQKVGKISSPHKLYRQIQCSNFCTLGDGQPV